LGPEIKKLTILINGLSKTYSMTGWRIGYAAGEKRIIGAMSSLQSHSTSNPTSIAQKAAIAAIYEQTEAVGKMVVEFRKRRDYLVERLKEIPGISCLRPEGAFYAFINISKILKKRYNREIIGDSVHLVELLLKEARVALVPGAAFGADNYVRLSYAASMNDIREGLARLREFIVHCS